MAVYWDWKCSNCGFTVETSWSHEFFRDDYGELHPYGHPQATSKEAKEKGDSVKDAITREFNTPVHEGWWHMPDNEVKSFTPICGECGTELIRGFVEKPCPKCGNIFHGLPIPAVS